LQLKSSDSTVQKAADAWFGTNSHLFTDRRCGCRPCVAAISCPCSSPVLRTECSTITNQGSLEFKQGQCDKPRQSYSAIASKVCLSSRPNQMNEVVSLRFIFAGGPKSGQGTVCVMPDVFFGAFPGSRTRRPAGTRPRRARLTSSAQASCATRTALCPRRPRRGSGLWLNSVGTARRLLPTASSIHGMHG
jgi:hypothetical protein